MQNNYEWIARSVVLAIHGRQIDEHGGTIGLRDAGLLESALARPQNAAAYGTPSIYELAGLLTLGIIKNHPFVDGNKRVGAVLLELFLDQNGFRLVAPDTDLYATIYNVAAGEIDDEAFFAWIRENSEAQ